MVMVARLVQTWQSRAVTMTDVTANQATDGAENDARRPSPVRDRLDDIDYDLDYELEIDGDDGE
jgi:hypothetical protein